MKVEEAIAALPKEVLEMTGKIKIAAYNVKGQLPVTCRCFTDDTNGLLYTGQGQSGYFETLDPEEKKKLAFIFDHETKFVLEDGKVINLDNPYEAAIWKWLRIHPFLAVDKVKGENQKEANFYVVNAKKEAATRIVETEKIDEARYQIRKLTTEKQQELAKAIGLANPQVLSADELTDYLRDKAGTQAGAAMILYAIDPSNKARVNAKIFFDRVLKYNVINRASDGAYYFGDPDTGFALGVTEELVLDYLLDSANTERVKMMRASLTEKTKISEAATV